MSKLHYLVTKCSMCNKQIFCTVHNSECCKQEGYDSCLCESCAVSELKLLKSNSVVIELFARVTCVHLLLKCSNLPLRIRNEAKCLYVLKRIVYGKFDR